MGQGVEGSVQQAEAAKPQQANYITVDEYNKIRSEAEEARRQLQGLGEIKQKWDSVTQRYNSDPDFKKQFDAAWDRKGAEKEAEGTGGKVSPDKVMDVKLRELNERLAQQGQKVDQLNNVLNYNAVVGARTNISQEYRAAFDDLADQAGFAYDSPAYNALFKSATQESYRLAAKYQLVNEQGAPDPLLKFTPQLVKEGFDIALDEFKKMGYDVQEQQRKETLKNAKLNAKKEEDWRNTYLDPKKLRTQSDRAKAAEAAFEEFLRRGGVTRQEIAKQL